MSLAKAIFSPLVGIPKAVQPDGNVPDRELCRIISALSDVRSDLVVLQHERRRLDRQRAGYGAQPHQGSIYAESDVDEPEDAT